MTTDNLSVAVLLLLFVMLPLLIIGLLVIVDIIRQPTMKAWKKVAWVAACFFVWPMQIVYVLVRPQRGRAEVHEVADDPHARLVAAVLDHESGTLSDVQFQRIAADLRHNSGNA